LFLEILFTPGFSSLRYSVGRQHGDNYLRKCLIHTPRKTQLQDTKDSMQATIRRRMANAT